MALSDKAKKRFIVAMARRAEAQEILDAIEGGANPQAAAVADLNQNISATYDQTEVQAISDKVDELLAALRAAGLMA